MVDGLGDAPSRNGITIAMIPCIGIYLSLQKYYVSGFTQGALK